MDKGSFRELNRLSDDQLDDRLEQVLYEREQLVGERDKASKKLSQTGIAMPKKDWKELNRNIHEYNKTVSSIRAIMRNRSRTSKGPRPKREEQDEYFSY